MNAHDEVDNLKKAILDIDAHAAPLGEDADGFVTGGYVISVGCLHRALGVVGHSAAKCKLCSPEWHGRCASDGLMLDVTSRYLRESLEEIGRACGVAVVADYGAKCNGVLLDEIIQTVTRLTAGVS